MCLHNRLNNSYGFWPKYVRNDPVNLVDRNGQFWECARWGETGCSEWINEPQDDVYKRCEISTTTRRNTGSSRNGDPFTNKVEKAINKATNKLEHASKDCLDLLTHLGVSADEIVDIIGTVKYANGLTSQDNLWEAVGGQVKGTSSSMSVSDLFNMGMPPYPSQIIVNALSASNNTIYLRPSAISWDTVVHEALHQVDGLDDKYILQQMYDLYGQEKSGIDLKGSTHQITEKIQEKCN